jgi:hypothetical protein
MKNDWEKLRTPQERRYDNRGRLLMRRGGPQAPDNQRYLEPAVAPYVAVRRLAALEAWLAL